MSLSTSDPDFQMDLGYLSLFVGKVNVIAEITEDHRINMGNPIPFDRIVMDPTRYRFNQNEPSGA